MQNLQNLHAMSKYACLAKSKNVNHFITRVNYGDTQSVVQTFKSYQNPVLWFDHSNETFSAVLLHGTICFNFSILQNEILIFV